MNHEKILTVIQSQKQGLARILTFVESELDGYEGLLDFFYPHTGGAIRVGITGPPGAGKSTITNQIAKHYRLSGKRVAIIAVDPSSPFTGGALLGDRVRMNEIGNDEGVFIRSMATRGSLGGLSRKSRDLADVFDAAGYDIILLETVGVGQSELDIVEAADTVLVVLVPESGDSIQAMKAGLMEIADIFVMNKSDRPGSDQAVSALNTILMMQDHDEFSWLRSIIKTVAVDGSGVAEVTAKIDEHIRFLKDRGLFVQHRLDKAAKRIKEVAEEKLIEALWANHPLDVLLENRSAGDLSPYHNAGEIVKLYKNT